MKYNFFQLSLHVGFLKSDCTSFKKKLMFFFCISDSFFFFFSSDAHLFQPFFYFCFTNSKSCWLQMLNQIPVLTYKKKQTNN